MCIRDSWDIGIRLIIGIIHTYPEICENPIVFFFTNTACAHTYPAYFPAVSGNLWKRSLQWKYYYQRGGEGGGGNSFVPECHQWTYHGGNTQHRQKDRWCCYIAIKTEISQCIGLLLEHLAKAQIAWRFLNVFWTFSEHLSLWNKSSHVSFFFFSLTSVRAFSADYMYGFRWAVNEVKGMQTPKHKTSVIQSGTSCWMKYWTGLGAIGLINRCQW